MKFDIISIVQIITMLTLVTITYGYINNLFINRNISKDAIIFELKGAIRISYSKTFVSDNYKTFEKIDVWRYCTIF